MRIPIFQLTWGFNLEGQFGLLFPSELTYESQDFSFVIPIPINFINGRPDYDAIDNALFDHEFFFPCELDNQYLEIDGEIGYSNDQSELNLSFFISGNNKINFEIDIFRVKPYYRLDGMKVKFLNQYVGKYKRAIYDRCIFVPLILKDVKALNNYYLENNGIFVGYTNEFGQIGNLGEIG